jgi:hypothetical protein
MPAPPPPSAALIRRAQVTGRAGLPPAGESRAWGKWEKARRQSRTHAPDLACNSHLQPPAPPGLPPPRTSRSRIRRMSEVTEARCAGSTPGLRSSDENMTASRTVSVGRWMSSCNGHADEAPRSVAKRYATAVASCVLYCDRGLTCSAYAVTRASTAFVAGPPLRQIVPPTTPVFLRAAMTSISVCVAATRRR